MQLVAGARAPWGLPRMNGPTMVYEHKVKKKYNKKYASIRVIISRKIYYRHFNGIQSCSLKLRFIAKNEIYTIKIWMEICIKELSPLKWTLPIN